MNCGDLVSEESAAPGWPSAAPAARVSVSSIRRSGLTAAVTAETRRITELYDQYGPVILRRSLKLLRDQDGAKDATHDVFLKLLRELPRETHPKAVLAWVYRTTTHHCLNILRETGRRRRREFQAAALTWDVVAAPDQDRVPQRLLAADVLSRFDAMTRAVAVAVLVDGMTHEEVAVALNVSRKTVGRKIAGFLEQARKDLAWSAP